MIGLFSEPNLAIVVSLCLVHLYWCPHYVSAHKVPHLRRCRTIGKYACASSALYLQHPVSIYRKICTDLLKSYHITTKQYDNAHKIHVLPLLREPLSFLQKVVPFYIPLEYLHFHILVSRSLRNSLWRSILLSRPICLRHNDYRRAIWRPLERLVGRYIL